MADSAALRRDIVVIGASAGGVPVLRELVAGLSAQVPASILVVQHIGSYPSILPELLSDSGPNPAVHGATGQKLEHGRIYVAPPDHHMIVHNGELRLNREAKENYARPAIDPLFRSAAVTCGPRVIGVVLSGRLDDGTAGLQAIKACGGVAVVQDPADAEEGSMPQSACDNVAVDHVVPRGQLAGTLVALAGSDVGAGMQPPEPLVREHRISLGEDDPMEHLDAIGKPSKIVCPDCNGVLWELTDSRPLRYRCHTGHAYTLRTLEHTQAIATEQALWGALRALEERQNLLRVMAENSRRHGQDAEVMRLESDAEHVARHARQMQRLLLAD